MPVELGGSWFTSEQHRVMAELSRYDLPIRTFPELTSVRWRTAGVVRVDHPVPGDELPRWREVLDFLRRDGVAYEEGKSDPRFSLSLTDYLAAIDVPLATRDFILGWWAITGGSHPGSGCVIDLISSLAVHGDVGDMDYLKFSPASGWSSLAEALAATEGLDVRLEQQVDSVHREGDHLIVSTSATAHVARAVVLATPVNTLTDIEFSPPLPAGTQQALGANSGTALKVWLVAEGVAVGSLAFGMGEGLHWLYGDRVVEGGTLVVSFGWPTNGFDPDNTADVARALHAFYPEAVLVAHHRHDWIHDPASQGTWATAPVGHPELLTAESFPPVGRIAFATADIATDHAGWFEGALASGAAPPRQYANCWTNDGDPAGPRSLHLLWRY